MSEVRSDNSEILHFDDPDFRVFIRKNEIPKECIFERESIHWHDEVELIYVEEGSVKYELNGRIVRMRAGEGIFVNSRQLHKIATDHKDSVLYCIIFHPMILEGMSKKIGAYISAVMNNVPYIMLSEKEDWQREILYAQRDIYESKDKKGGELLVMQQLYRIWVNLVQNVSHYETEKDKNTGKNLTILKQIITYIQDHYTEKITLEDLCVAGNVGKTKCSTLFSGYINMTPVEYIQYYRIAKSIELLEGTDLNITEIAYESGFSESSYYTETFRKFVGMSPTKYRVTYFEYKDKN